MDLTVAVAQQFDRFIAAGKVQRLINGVSFRATAGHTERSSGENMRYSITLGMTFVFCCCCVSEGTTQNIDDLVNLTPEAVRKDNRLSMLESELLGVPFAPKNPRAVEPRYSLYKIISFSYPGAPSPCQVRIWQPELISWPGLNNQIIEVVKDGKRLSSAKVGDEPIMEDAWGYKSKEGLLIHILCRHRWGPAARGVYVYNIDEDASISLLGLFFQKADVEVVEVEERESMQKLLDHIEQE